MKVRFIFCLVVIFFGGFAMAHASQSVGTILSPNASVARVCHDASCSYASGGHINFLPGAGSPVVITDSGITGNAWGSEIGWINMSPAGSGVGINPNTGVLSGYAWSQQGGYINFAPTGYGVSINSSGQFVGHAWVGGMFGGFIKFDCGVATSTCVQTDWVPIPYRSVATVASAGGGSSSRSQTICELRDTQIERQNQGIDYTSLTRADINDSGKVDIFDFNALMVGWGKGILIDKALARQGICPGLLRADINMNGIISIQDFNLLMVHWGKKVPL